MPSDPGAPDENAAEAKLLFNVGEFFEKGLRMGSGTSTRARVPLGGSDA